MNSVKNQLRPLSDFQGSMALRAYESLKDAILTLKFKPGELLKKPAICIELDISRSPLADALSRLALDNLVSIIPQAGTYVAKISMEEIREAAFLREALELAAVNHVAPQITNQQLQQARRSLRAQVAAIDDRDLTQFYQLDEEFHEMLLSFTGYPRVAGMAKSSWIHVNRARKLLLPLSSRLDDALKEHGNIVDALEARNAEMAVQAMSHHLNQLIKIMQDMYLRQPNLFTINER